MDGWNNRGNSAFMAFPKWTIRTTRPLVGRWAAQGALAVRGDHTRVGVESKRVGEEMQSR